MYSDLTKAEAFTLYCSGLSFRKIADILKNHPGCEKITHSTVKKWSETPNLKGATWDDRKLALQEQIEQNQNDLIVKQKVDVVKETDGIIADIIADLQAGELKFKTKDAAVYALKTIAEYNKKLKDETKRVNIEDQVTLLLEAMNDIPEVGEVLSKHWNDVYNIFQKKAKALEKDKRLGR